MRRWAVVAGVMLCVGSGHDVQAQDARKLTELRLKERAGYFLVFFPPRYPNDALRTGEAATIDVFGKVAADGRFTVERVESDKPVEDFEDAIRKASRNWTLRPAYDGDCEPVAAPAQAKLWFEVRAGEPIVAFAQPLDEKSEEDPPLKWVQRPKIAYPREERRIGRELSVEAILRVRPDGKPDKVRVVPGPHGRRFAAEVEDAMEEARFEPTGEAKPLCALYQVVFRLVP